MKLSANKPCPCHSGRKHKSCCGPTLRGQPAGSPEALMRSRFTAYATGNIRHIVETTHPHGPHSQSNLEQWEAEIRAFCEAYRFTGLTIHSHQAESGTGRVHFSATLENNQTETTLEEDSLFYTVDSQWLYWGRVSER